MSKFIPMYMDELLSKDGLELNRFKKELVSPPKTTDLLEKTAN